MNRLKISLLATAITIAVTGNVAAQVSPGSGGSNVTPSVTTKRSVEAAKDVTQSLDRRQSWPRYEADADNAGANSRVTDSKSSPLLNMKGKDEYAGGKPQTMSAKIRDAQTYSGTSVLSPAETVATPSTNDPESHCRQMPVAMRADANCITKVSSGSAVTNSPDINCGKLPIPLRAAAGCGTSTD